MSAQSLVRLSALVRKMRGQARTTQQPAIFSQFETLLSACPGQASRTSPDSVLVRLSPYGVIPSGQASRCITTGTPQQMDKAPQNGA